MKCFVTGATGFIGNNLVNALLKRKERLNILVRTPAYDKFFTHKNISVFHGDLHDIDVINEAMKDCDVVYHLAAYADIWSKDKTLAFKTNITGTNNILEAALKNGIKKVVFTSSAATLTPSMQKEEVDESFPPPEKYLTHYEITKQQAEQLCYDFCKKGLDVVIVNPTRVFGPGFLNKSNSVTIMIKNYLKGTWRIIPDDGSQIGNYVFIDDVVNGHILAMSKGISGERYILGGNNVSFNGFFEVLAKVSGKKRKMIHLPYSIMLGFSKLELLKATKFGIKPLITPPWVQRYLQKRPVSSNKAMEKLSYTITPLPEGMKKTIHWLKTKN